MNNRTNKLLERLNIAVRDRREIELIFSNPNSGTIDSDINDVNNVTNIVQPVNNKSFTFYYHKNNNGCAIQNIKDLNLSDAIFYCNFYLDDDIVVYAQFHDWYLYCIILDKVVKFRVDTSTGEIILVSYGLLLPDEIGVEYPKQVDVEFSQDLSEETNAGIIELNNINFDKVEDIKLNYKVANKDIVINCKLVKEDYRQVDIVKTYVSNILKLETEQDWNYIELKVTIMYDTNEILINWSKKYKDLVYTT